jgi:hypothetical protein
LSEEYDAWAHEPENKRDAKMRAACALEDAVYRDRAMQMQMQMQMQQTWIQPNNAPAQEEAVQALASDYMAGR